MSEKNRPFLGAKKWIARIAPNAIWKVVEWVGGSSLVTSVGHALMSEFHRTPVDWYWFGAVSGLGSAAVGVGLWRETKNQKAFPRTIESRTAELTSPPKLVIHSAFYGVEGGPEDDVAERYLRPRIAGGATLVGWIGADLFGPLDPAIGKHKRAKVRYSYEGREATIERRENEFLVLPEDPRLHQAKQPATANEVREYALAIVGELCGFLRRNGHSVEVPALTPYDKIATGLEDRQSDSAIRDQFPTLFTARVLKAKELIGDRGLLDTESGFTSVGDVLSMSSGVWNAEDVRAIIAALENTANALSSKFLHGVGFQFASTPLLVATPLPAAFTPLQVETFQLAKELREFLKALGPRPRVNPKDFEDTHDSTYRQLVAQGELAGPWVNKMIHGYAGRYSARIQSVVHRLGELGYVNPYLNNYLFEIATEENIQQVSDNLVALAMESAKKDWGTT